MESTIAKAEKIGSNAKIKEQALMDVRTVLDIAGIYGEEMLEEACGKALKGFHMITYNTLIPYIKELLKCRKNEAKPGDAKKHEHGIVRGADYYRKGGTKQ